MRRKIPKTTSEEIRRISQNKQDRILNYIREAKTPISIKEISEALMMTIDDTRNQFGNLKNKNLIECVDNNPNGYLYVLYEKGKTQNYKAKAEKESFKQAIRPEEIQAVRRTVKVGDPFYILDEEGNKKRIRVTDTRYPYICLFDNGHAYSWANVALCKRPGIRILGQWGTTEGGSK